MAVSAAGGTEKPKGSRSSLDGSVLGLIFKIVALAAVVGFLTYTGWQLLNDGVYGFAAAFFITALLITLFFVSKSTIPLRWIAPGLIFLILFQLYPIFFTVYTAFTNYSTGRNIEKPAAIAAISNLTYVPEKRDLELDSAPGRGWQRGDLDRRSRQRPDLSGGAG